MDHYNNSVDIAVFSALQIELDKLTTNGWLKKLWKSIKVVVIADAAGAATGFFKGFLTVLGTWQAAGARALAGGFGGSAGAAIKEILILNKN